MVGRNEDTGIYLIENVRNGRRYVGSASSFRKRWREHARQLLEGRHHSRFLQRCYDANGADSFVFKKIIFCDKKDLIFYEQAAMDAYKPEYNSAPVAGSQLGYRHTEETRAKMSKARRKDFSPMKGRNQPEEARRKISENRKGKGCVPCSAEKKAKLSAAHKGRIISDEQRAKISAKLSGHKQSQATIEKRREKLIGRKMPESFKLEASRRMKGIVHPPHVLEKMRRSMSKIPDEKVRAIRAMVQSGINYVAISAETGIARHTVADIAIGRKYAWVTP